MSKASHQSEATSVAQDHQSASSVLRGGKRAKQNSGNKKASLNSTVMSIRDERSACGSVEAQCPPMTQQEDRPRSGEGSARQSKKRKLEDISGGIEEGCEQDQMSPHSKKMKMNSGEARSKPASPCASSQVLDPRFLQPCSQAAECSNEQPHECEEQVVQCQDQVLVEPQQVEVHTAEEVAPCEAPVCSNMEEGQDCLNLQEIGDALPIICMQPSEEMQPALPSQHIACTDMPECQDLQAAEGQCSQKALQDCAESAVPDHQLFNEVDLG